MAEPTQIPDRIYIGGLDPPRLTAQDVLGRLPPGSAVEIKSIQSYADKPYCHVTATTTSTVAGEASAFDVLFKTFNNVKWKGCRLTVQAAQPHFLERLRCEIQEREERTLEQELKVEEKDEDQPPLGEATGGTVTKIPRRLRIRKKFGEEAYHVDTKPWFVDNWSHFRMARDKLKKRLEKHKAEKLMRELNTTPQPLTHRAVHIRFDEASSAVTLRDVIDDDGSRSDDLADSSPLLEDTSDDDSSSSDASEEEEKGKVGTSVNGEYTWSDEDNEEGEENHGEDEESEWKPAQTGVSNSSSDNQHQAKNGAREEGMALVQSRQDQKISRGAAEAEYKWSSDDDSSIGDNEEIEKANRNVPLRQVSQSDEFAAGFADDAFAEGGDDVEEDELPANDNGVAGEADLTNDVLANLGILSSLFSDVEGVKPVMGGEIHEDDEDEGKKKELQPQTGFGKSGMMLRYDPNDASMQQFEIEDDDQEEINGNSRSEGDKIESPPQVDAVTTSGNDAGQEDSGHLYEEKKLESVFREARDTWKGTENTKETKGGNAGGLFSFGFDLDPVEPEPTDMAVSGGLDIGVGLPTSGLPTKQASDSVYMQTDDGTTASEANVAHIKHAEDEKRIKGFCFPEDLLAKYQSDFFSANKREDNEEADKEAWSRERQTLTLDWKRKRKHAQGRIQKRMKIR